MVDHTACETRRCGFLQSRPTVSDCGLLWRLLRAAACSLQFGECHPAFRDALPSLSIPFVNHQTCGIASEGLGRPAPQVVNQQHCRTLCQTILHATLRCASLPTAGRRPSQLLKRRREDGAMAQQPRWPPAVPEVFPQPSYDAFTAEAVLPLKRLRLEASRAAALGCRSTAASARALGAESAPSTAADSPQLHTLTAHPLTTPPCP